jgi:hypothetical protein
MVLAVGETFESKPGEKTALLTKRTEQQVADLVRRARARCGD